MNAKVRKCLKAFGLHREFGLHAVLILEKLVPSFMIRIPFLRICPSTTTVGPWVLMDSDHGVLGPTDTELMTHSLAEYLAERRERKEIRQGSLSCTRFHDWIRELLRLASQGVPSSIIIFGSPPTSIRRILVLRALALKYRCPIVLILPFGHRPYEVYFSTLLLASLEGALVSMTCLPDTPLLRRPHSRTSLIGPVAPPTYFHREGELLAEPPLPRPLSEREVDIGFFGAPYPKRMDFIRQLGELGLHVRFPKSVVQEMTKLVNGELGPFDPWIDTIPRASHDELWEFMSECRFLLNFGSYEELETADGVPSSGFKGRIVESMIAGAVTLNDELEQTSKLFLPNGEFMPFTSPHGVCETISLFKTNPAACQAMVDRAYEKARSFYGRAFWETVASQLPGSL